MKVAIIVYNKNAQSIYPAHWIKNFKDSILNQTFKDFDIIECNYGDGDFHIFFGDGSVDKDLHIIRKKHDNFANCLNEMLDYAFKEEDYDFVFNTNVDDYYAPEWIEKLLAYRYYYHLVSSNYYLVKNDAIVLRHYFNELKIDVELAKDHNIICHPAVMYTKRFWFGFIGIDEGNRYNPAEIPFEDMKLWQRALTNGYKFKIAPELLCYHRLHDNSVGHNLKEN